jgi:hypothetical protein
MAMSRILVKHLAQLTAKFNRKLSGNKTIVLMNTLSLLAAAPPRDQSKTHGVRCHHPHSGQKRTAA